jgi:hypothetical protein
VNLALNPEESGTVAVNRRLSVECDLV